MSSSKQRKPEPEKCMTPECVRPSKPGNKGMCRSCHSAVARLVRQGRITWQQLEEKGLAKPERDPQTTASPIIRAIVNAGISIDRPPQPAA